MKVFVVHAHPETKSFNGAMRDVAVATLTGAGHEVRLSDLYAMGFDAVGDRRDFVAACDPDFFKYQREQKHAFDKDGFAPDIRAEQEKLAWSDLVIFQFPLWWFSVPAILKGWFDRVLAFGFSYGGGRLYDTAPLRGRRALIAMTAGSLRPRYTAGGLFGDIEQTLYPIHVGVLNFVGLDVHEPFIAWAPARQSAEQRTVVLEAYRARLLGLEREAPRRFHSMRDHPDPTGEYRLPGGPAASKG